MPNMITCAFLPLALMVVAAAGELPSGPIGVLRIQLRSYATSVQHDLQARDDCAIRHRCYNDCLSWVRICNLPAAGH